MALFHLSVTQTKRSAGQSAIASAAYRAGERLYSEYYGEYSDYTRKGGVICSDILLPSHAPPEYADRQTLYGRMIEIYLLTSLAPIPFATVPNRETGHMGQNYFRSLFAVGFQGLLILVCVAIYAVLIQSIATDGDPIGAIWGCVGYTVLLCFTLFKTGSLAKSIFGCH